MNKLLIGLCIFVVIIGYFIIKYLSTKPLPKPLPPHPSIPPSPAIYLPTLPSLPLSSSSVPPPVPPPVPPHS